MVIATGPRVTTKAYYPSSRTYTVIEDTDFEGNPVRTVYPSGREVRMDFDGDNRVTRIRVKDGTVFKIITQLMTYAPNGPLATVLYGDGYTQTRSNDLSYRLTGLKDQKSSTTRRNLTMGYEARDNLTTITDLQGSANNEVFTYTPRESLATATGPYGAMTFTYDGVGNRVAYKLGTATDSYTYPPTSNRLGTITLAAGGARAFSYDAAGNVTLDNRTGSGYGYTYNSAGRMSEFRINGVLQGSYKYDALGRQVVRTLTSPTAVTIHSVFDSSGRKIAEYNEATSSLIREYVWNGWEAVAVIEGGIISYIRTDHIGRPASVGWVKPTSFFGLPNHLTTVTRGFCAQGGCWSQVLKTLSKG